MTTDDGYRPARTPDLRDGISAYQSAAWRAPGATRFDARPANDFLARAEAAAPQTLTEPAVMEPLPRWLIVALGAVVAAVMGALLGGALSVY